MTRKKRFGTTTPLIGGFAAVQSDREGYSKGILFLIWGRVAFLFLLSTSVVIFNHASLFPPVSPEIRALVISIGAYLLLSAAYFVFYYRKTTIRYWFAFVQIMLDIPLWAVLVVLTGGADSFFVFLFHSSILIAGVYCGGRGIIFSLIMGISLYIVAALLEPAELVPMNLRPFAVLVEHDPVAFFYRIGMDVGSMLLVAALTGFLVKRVSKVGEKLQKTEAIFKDLNKLNEAVISLVPSGLITVDDRGIIKTMNGQARKMLNLDERASGDVNITRLVDLTAEELTKSKLSKEITVGSGDEERIYECSVSPLLNDKNEAVGGVIHLLEITDMLGMQRELARMERNSALGNLAVGLAHEIRNPLGSISGSVEMIMQGSAVSEEDKRLLQIVAKEAKRINNLMASLLSLSRQEMKLNLGPFSIADLADEVVSIFRASEESFGLEFDIRISPSLFVEADRERIGQVLLNLIKNGAESTAGREKGCVIIDAEGIEGGKVEVMVKDNGSGILENNVSRIFEDYFTTKNLGIGLGLSVSRQIIFRHGETIGYRPGREKGSVFYFTLKKAAE